MTVFVRTYQTLGEPEPGERFMARAIAEVGKPGAKREGFSVFFYAETAEDAQAKAEAWIVAERERAETIGINRQQAAKRRAA